MEIHLKSQDSQHADQPICWYLLFGLLCFHVECSGFKGQIHLSKWPQKLKKRFNKMKINILTKMPVIFQYVNKYISCWLNVDMNIPLNGIWFIISISAARKMAMTPQLN